MGPCTTQHDGKCILLVSLRLSSEPSPPLAYSLIAERDCGSEAWYGIRDQWWSAGIVWSRVIVRRSAYIECEMDQAGDVGVTKDQ
jgi:hypothetical protein